MTEAAIISKLFGLWPMLAPSGTAGLSYGTCAGGWERYTPAAPAKRRIVN